MTSTIENINTMVTSNHITSAENMINKSISTVISDYISLYGLKKTCSMIKKVVTQLINNEKTTTDNIITAENMVDGLISTIITGHIALYGLKKTYIAIEQQIKKSKNNIRRKQIRIGYSELKKKHGKNIVVCCFKCRLRIPKIKNIILKGHFTKKYCCCGERNVIFLVIKKNKVIFMTHTTYFI